MKVDDGVLAAGTALSLLVLLVLVIVLGTPPEHFQGRVMGHEHVPAHVQLIWTGKFYTPTNRPETFRLRVQTPQSEELVHVRGADYYDVHDGDVVQVDKAEGCSEGYRVRRVRP